MENYSSFDNKFELVIGNRTQGQVLNTKQAGQAFKSDEDHFYRLKLWMYEKIYFLVPNRDSQTRYTIFAKAIVDEDRTYFQEPIGCAWIPEDLTSHLEIKFNLFPRHIFMSLFPHVAVAA